MLRQQANPRAELVHLALVTVLAIFLAGCCGAVAAEAVRALQLEVYINDQPTHLIGSFTELSDRRIGARRAELVEVGLKVPGPGEPSELIVIDDIPGVTYRYDERTQSIHFSLSDNQRIAQTYDAHAKASSPVVAPTDYGSVLNYTLFAASTKAFDTTPFSFFGANAMLDGRVFGPYGTLSQSVIVGSTTTKEADVLRLDTYWKYSDPTTLLTYRAGDAVSGSLAWTRPIRLGGLQVQRNFGLRPDLITLPLPTVSGSAAVPSTVDVYVNNMKTHSQDVLSGPYQINNVPVIANGGDTRIVIRDSTGREIVTSLPFFTSPMLLRPGLIDFSFEAGFPRLNFGTESSTYVDSPVSSVSLRGGIYDWLTLEGHVEAGAGLVLGGLGAVTSLGPWGLLSLAGSASHYGEAFGFKSYVAYDTRFSGIYFHMSTQRTFGAYNDLASVTAYQLPVPTTYFGAPLSGTPISSFLTTARPAQALDTISIGVPLSFDNAWLHASYLHLDLADGKRSDLITVSYSRPLFANASLYATAFSDINDRQTVGVFFGVSISLGETVSASAGVSSTSSGTNVTFEAAKSMLPEPGSFGWRIRDSEGNLDNRYAAASYRSSVAEVGGGLQQVGKNTSGFLQANGSIAAMGGGVFLSNRIDDAFAVVNVGAPHVGVFHENRPVGMTNSDGQILIPTLRSFQANNIAIDPRDLPVDTDAPTTQNITAPTDRSGVVVNFGVERVKAAVVVFSDRAGKFIAPGSRGQLEGSNEPFTIGYDGRAYIKGLGANNNARVGDAAGECRATFAFTPRENGQVVIGPVICQ